MLMVPDPEMESEIKVYGMSIRTKLKWLPQSHLICMHLVITKKTLNHMVLMRMKVDFTVPEATVSGTALILNIFTLFRYQVNTIMSLEVHNTPGSRMT